MALSSCEMQFFFVCKKILVFQPIDLIVVEFEVEFGYPAPKDPPTELVDNTLNVLKNSLGFTASLPSTGTVLICISIFTNKQS